MDFAVILSKNTFKLKFKFYTSKAQSAYFATTNVQCTVYNVQCTVYSVQCTVYSVIKYNKKLAQPEFSKIYEKQEHNTQHKEIIMQYYSNDSGINPYYRNSTEIGGFSL